MTPAAFKSARKSLGLTQTEMARFLGGYSIRQVQYWESGEQATPPAVDVVLAIAQTCQACRRRMLRTKS